MTQTAPGLLFVMTDIPAEIEADFNHWYDREHIPERLAVPGFAGARRYRAVEGAPAYQALYDLESVAVLDTPAYGRLNEEPSEWSKRIVPQFRNAHRGVYTQLFPEGAEAAPAPVGTEALLLVGLAPPPGHEEEFEAWYNLEHIAVYELADAEVPLGEAWRQAAETPWTLRQRALPRTMWLRIRSRALVPATAQ
jgi:hypothetical protein